MRKSNMQAIASVGAMTRPQFRQMPTLDLAGAIDNFYKSRNDADTRANRQAYIDALQGGDQEQIDKTLAAYDPAAYAKVMDTRQQREWQLADADTQFERQKAILGLQNQYAKGLALFKAQNGIGSNGLVNINRNPLDKKRIETIGKKMDENIAASQARLDDYNRMEQLLSKPNVTTGGLKGIAQDKLPDALLDADTVELRSIIKKIVPQMRPAGSGTTSDRDMKIFEQATVGLGKSKDANLNIVRGRKLVDENNIAKEELRYQWLNEGGNLGDFDKKWREYLNQNPIFANDSAKLNQARKDPYEWFYNPQGSQPQAKAMEDPLGLR